MATGIVLRGAKSRLLPASIPFLFFGAAVVFHPLAWLAVVAGADRLPDFAGGLGWPPAALHLITAGVLAMSAIGASLQLLPVATRQPVGSLWLPRAIGWLYLPGVAALALGMAIPMPSLLAAGAAATVVALAIYTLLIARNLRAAKGMRVVVLHGWAAIASLLVALGAALALAGAYVGIAPIDRGTAVGLHLVFAVYGFMVMLLMGFSYILLPMFALADVPAERPALLSAALAIAALLAFAAALRWPTARWLPMTATSLGIAAFALHVVLMTKAIRSGMRSRLGLPLRLMQYGWLAIGASLAAALAIALDASLPRLPALAVVLAIVGLVGFLLGVLARIVPFLAAMHAGSSKRPPTPSQFTAERPLAVAFGCHLVATLLLIGAIAAGSAWLARAAGLIGAAGAGAFVLFFAAACRRI